MDPAAWWIISSVVLMCFALLVIERMEVSKEAM